MGHEGVTHVRELGGMCKDVLDAMNKLRCEMLSMSSNLLEFCWYMHLLRDMPQKTSMVRRNTTVTDQDRAGFYAQQASLESEKRTPATHTIRRIC